MKDNPWLFVLYLIGFLTVMTGIGYVWYTFVQALS